MNPALRAALRAAASRFADDIADAFEAASSIEGASPPTTRKRTRVDPPLVEVSDEALEKARRALLGQLPKRSRR